MLRAVALFVLVAVAAAGLVGLGYLDCLRDHKTHTVVKEVPMTQPSCPTEDSCRPLYANGHWTIVVDPG
jgi:hypothetical protein